MGYAEVGGHSPTPCRNAQFPGPKRTNLQPRASFPDVPQYGLNQRSKAEGIVKGQNALEGHQLPAQGIALG